MMLSDRLERCERVLGEGVSKEGRSVEDRVKMVEEAVMKAGPEVKEFMRLYESLSHLLEDMNYLEVNLPYDVKVR